MQDRPRIKIQNDSFMQACKYIAISCVLACWGLAFYYYQNLPSSIPIHFDTNGNANNFGSKATIFLFPLIATFLIFGINWVAKYPHTFNYTKKLTDENAERLYKQGVKLLFIVSAIVGFILLICLISTIDAVFNEGNKMEKWSLPVILGLSGMLTIYSLIAAIKSSRVK